MPRPLWFFYLLLFFIFGIGLNSYFKNFFISAAISLLFSLILFLFGYLSENSRFQLLAFLLLASVLGAGYYQIYKQQTLKEANLIFDKEIIFEAKVVSDPEVHLNSQETVLDLKNPYQGKILLKTAKLPNYFYGDILRIAGVIKKPVDRYAEYLSKDRIFGIVTFSKIEILKRNQGSFLKSSLFKIKRALEGSLKKSLKFDQAAFLNGLIFGDRSEFSKAFEKKLSLTGTTHLVALSGYNISIIILAISSALGYLGIRRRFIFWLTVFCILAFVLMTGAQASVVRAAVMGLLLVLAGYTGRIYSFRNAIVFAAFLMILFNPLTLRYDLGFQLSFLSLLGIVYLKPALMKFLKINEEKPSLFNWRENAFNTLGAQLAVVPLLLANFGNFSSVALVANILILGTIPWAMLLGFLTSVFGFVSYIVGIVSGWFTYPLVSFQLGIIDFFAQIGFPLAVKNFSWPIALIYYVLLIIFIKIYAFRFVRRQK